jgi:hypothetical protein
VFSVRDCDPSHPTACLSVRYFIAPTSVHQLFLQFPVTRVNHIKNVRCAGMWPLGAWKWRHQVSPESRVSLTQRQGVISQKVWIFSCTSMRTWITETTHSWKCNTRSNFFQIFISARICLLQFKLCCHWKFEIGLRFSLMKRSLFFFFFFFFFFFLFLLLFFFLFLFLLFLLLVVISMLHHSIRISPPLSCPFWYFRSTSTTT